MNPLLLVIDDHPLYRVGVIRALSISFTVMEADCLTTGLEVLAQHPQTALVLLDLRLPDATGLSGLEVLASRFGDIPRVVISGDDDPALPGRIRAAGASGFVHKSADTETLCASLLHVVEGGTVFGRPPSDVRTRSNLSLRELEVLTLASRGLPNRDIASRLKITERTVKAHLKAAFVALGARSRTEAAYLASRNGLIEPA